MATLAHRIQKMPGATTINIEPWPRPANSVVIRVSLALGLLALIALLFTQPYSRPAAGGAVASPVPSGVEAVDVSRLPRLSGWHVAGADDLGGGAAIFLRSHGAPLSGHVRADFAGTGSARDSAYLLLDAAGQHRVSMIAGGQLLYDAIFPNAQALARIPKATLARIQWTTSPQFAADGDGLLVIQNAENPTASLVLLKHGSQIYSARPADYNQIDLSE
jgi:hypothetical protein